MFDTIGGLPVHALIVHAVVVLLPLASIAVLVAAVWPKFRTWAGPLPLVTAVLATVSVPVATNSGEYLKGAIKATENPAVLKHQALGDLMLYWGIGLVVVAALLYWVHRSTKSARLTTPKQPVLIAVAVLAVVVSVGTMIHIYRVGDSGARAVWDGVGTSAHG